jgi:dipeptidyl aminopeptidase/acylaminoacyl peptidase
MKSCVLPALLLAAGVHAAPPTVEDFQRPPAFSGPVLSPDGKHVAAVMSMGKELTTLVVIPTDAPTEATPIKAFAGVDIGSITWLKDDRLAFTVQPQTEPHSWGVLPGLWTITRDGKQVRQWVSTSFFGSSLRTPQAARMLPGDWWLNAVPYDGSDTVIMANDEWRLRLNVATGERQSLTVNNPDKIFDWVLDTRLDLLFAFQALEDGRWRVLRRGAQGELTPWSTSQQVFSAPPRVPRWVDTAGHLYVTVATGGSASRTALFRATGLEPDAPLTELLASTRYDIDPEPILDRDTGTTIGVRYETDQPRTLWLDATLGAAQADIDRQLPGAVNQLSCIRCLKVPQLLVTSLSDRRPPRYFIYSRDTQRLMALAPSRPWMPEGSPQQVATVVARDGLPIAVQLTRPVGAPAPAPTVLLVHGGPWVRGNQWGWSPESQFYASRGYLVIEADFRGSVGYGERHFRAGFRQWGQAMQDDLDDVLAWATKQGLSDPARVCMVGASYGGYAALMGLVRSEKSGQLTCAVATFAPTDLLRLESRHWSTLSADTLRLTLAPLLGDATTDAAMLQAQSPLVQAERIHAPLLLAYGKRDRRVPLAHGTELRDKLTALGRPPEWLAYDDAGHGLWRADQRRELMSRIEAFLATHLAPRH